MTTEKLLSESVGRLRNRIGARLKDLGSSVVDPVSVRRYREAMGLESNPELGVPAMMVAHLLRADADVSKHQRPSESIDDVLGNPVNGGTEIHFKRPLQLGDVVSGELILVDASLKAGKSGPLAVVITEARYVDAQAREIAKARSTMIYRGVRA
jgi:hypothetical protein